jgi:transcriptional repressor AefR-like protein
LDGKVAQHLALLPRACDGAVKLILEIVVSGEHCVVTIRRGCLSKPALFNFSEAPNAETIKYVVDIAVRVFLRAYAVAARQ